MQKNRYNTMVEFDKNLKAEHQVKYLISMDEVERGSIYGNAYIGISIIFDPACMNSFEGKFDESKALNKNQLTLLNTALKTIDSNQIYLKTLELNVERINREEGLGNSFRAIFREAILICLEDNKQITVDNTLILLDGIDRPLEHIVQALGFKFISTAKADTKSATCAIASIIAKSASNEWLQTLPEKELSKYDLLNNKGYKTKKHVSMIKQNGLSVNHRYYA